MLRRIRPSLAAALALAKIGAPAVPALIETLRVPPRLRPSRKMRGYDRTIVNSNSSFECPNHGARYDSNGNVTRQPNASGSATKLPAYSTSYDAATDILTITSSIV